MADPVRNFYQLLDTPSHLPTAIVPLRYSLVMTLRQVDDIVSELMQLIAIFRKMCRSSSREMMLRRQEIQRKLDTLQEVSEDILQNVDRLLLQIPKEKEKRLLPVV